MSKNEFPFNETAGKSAAKTTKPEPSVKIVVTVSHGKLRFCVNRKLSLLV